MAQSRYTYRRSFFSGYFTTGVKWLLIINTAVFLLWFAGGAIVQHHLLTLFALTPELTVRNFMVWQVWLGAAVALQLCARVLNRYGKSGDPAAF